LLGKRIMKVMVALI